MIWKDQPVEKEIEEINSKIGTVPSGKTVEGQITELNSNLGNRFVNVGIVDASEGTALSRVQAVINAVTTNSKDVNFIGIGKYSGICYVGGVLYANKLYGGGYYSSPWESGYWKLDNGTLSVYDYALNSHKATIEPIVISVSKNNGTTAVPFSRFGTLVNGHSYIVTAIGNNSSWSYVGVLYYSGTCKLVTLNNQYIEATVNNTQFTFKNTHTEYDQTITVELTGRY